MTFHDHPDDPVRPLLKEKRHRGSRAEGLDEVSIRREERRLADSRRSDRHQFDERTVQVRWCGGDHDVRLINLSGGGAMIGASIKPNLCDHLDLRLGEGAPVECLVRWVKDGRIGLEFAHETQLHCSKDERAALLREVLSGHLSEESDGCDASADNSTDNRTGTRHPLIWAGELLSGPSSRTVRLRNVSNTGALIECREPPKVGAPVVLELGEAGSVDATVCWAVGDHLGLRFDESFDLRRLAKSRPKVAPPTWLRPSYLEAEVSAESAWDHAWSRMSVNELQAELEGFLKH